MSFYNFSTFQIVQRAAGLAGNLRRRSLSVEQEQEVVDVHNAIRRNVSPSGSNLMKMVRYAFSTQFEIKIMLSFNNLLTEFLLYPRKRPVLFLIKHIKNTSPHLTYPLRAHCHIRPRYTASIFACPWRLFLLTPSGSGRHFFQDGGYTLFLY